MNGPERAAAAHATGAVVARVTRAVAGTHAAITDVVRVGLTPLGDSGRLPLEATALIARFNFGVVESAARGVAAIVAPVLDATAPEVEAASVHPPAVAWLAALGAAFGDQLVADDRVRALTVPMSLRSGGALVAPAPEPDPVGLVDGASPSVPSPTVVVFVHGLGNHESSWGQSYLDLSRDHGATPFTVRYTTGQAIADSGAELAELLEGLVAAWPVPVERIVLVGHSMGGLVIRAGLAGAGPWKELVSDVVTLGTPHAGAPLERISARGLAMASTFAPAAPILALGDERSRGIKDLGSADVAPPTAGPRWHLVASTLRQPAPVGVMGRARSGVLGALGDGLVTVDSAFAVAPHLITGRLLIEGTGHMSLLDHPTVADVLRGVLSGV